MAKISTYTNENPSDDDLLIGSEFIRTVNNQKEFTTANYRLVDLAEYFASFYIQTGTTFS